MMLRTLLFLSVLLCLTLSVQAQSTTLRVQPTETTIADTGQSFTVSVLIEEFTQLHAYSIELTYDPDVLTHTAITKGDVFQEYGDLFLTSGSDASAGKVLADHAILGTESVSGEESVAFRVTFETVAEGTSALAFGTTRLRDGANDSIAHGGEDGNVEVGGDAEALADLSLTLAVDDPAPDVGAEVTFTLNLTNVGPDAATGVVVNQSLPDAFTLIDASPDVGAFDADAGAWTVGTIPADETVRLELRARGDETGDFTSEAAVQASEVTDPDSTPGGGGEEDDTASVGVLVGSANAPPVAQDDAVSTGAEQTISIAVLENDSDPEGALDPASVAITSGPSNGTAEPNPSNGHVVYLPNPGFSGTDQFSYRVQDAEGAVSNDATVTISVSTANQAPTFTSTPPTTAQRGVLYRYTVTAQDPEGDPLALSAPTLPSWLILTDQGGGEGTLEGTPDADGTYSVVLRVTDGDQASTEQSFSITVSVNAAPTVVDDEAETQEDTEVVIAVLDNDSDPNGDALTVSSVTDPMHGTAAIQDDATIRYVPAPDYNGMDQFQYVVSDGINERQGTVTVTVTAVNDAPGVPTITAPDNGARITISGDPSTTMMARWEAVSDPDGDTITYTWQLSLSETFATDDLLYEADVDEQTTASIEYGTLGPLLTERGVALEEDVRAFHRVRAHDGEAEARGEPLEIVFERGTLTNAEENQTELPHTVQLAAVYPNPVRQEAHVAFSLPEAQQVTITVYDVQGRVVEVLTDRVWTAGRHQVVWEASTLPSGMYLCRLQADAIEVTRSLIRLR